jgi:TPP-dependent pyruvate/acetoin dehydrogenase alpha subunit
MKRSQVLNSDGNIREGAVDPEIPKSQLLNMYKTMVGIAHMDSVFYEAQRQGRISFYM